MTRKMDSISLGQGQGPIAEAMIATAQDRGGWVFFAECSSSGVLDAVTRANI